MRQMPDGHQGLENEVRKEESVGDFTLALSYLKTSDRTAYFVVHAWSSTFDYGAGLQRSKVRSTSDKSFLDRLGFEYSNTCNVLSHGKCHYLVLEQVDRQAVRSHPPGSGGTNANRRFDALVDNFQDIYELMSETDEKLQRAGFELPWDGLNLRSIEESSEEAVYEWNQVWDFYQDFKERLDEAQNEVFIIDAYVNEELFELYVDRLADEVNIRILTKNPKGAFENVAEKYAQQRGDSFEVRTHNSCHDRIVFIDRSCYVLGQSIKDAARKPTYLVEIEDFDEFERNFETLWEEADELIT